jgi:HK97 family phage prohead protease
MIVRKAVNAVDLTCAAGKREVVATVSTDSVDRDREVIVPKGINLKNYQDNPVVLYGHMTSMPPVAKSLWIKTVDDALISKMVFAETEFADDIYRLYKDGFMKAFSIGFQYLDGSAPEEKEIVANPSWAKARFVIRKSELYEYSCVSVPANPDALSLAVSKGSIDVAEETLLQMGIRVPNPRRPKLFMLPKSACILESVPSFSGEVEMLAELPKPPRVVVL